MTPTLTEADIKRIIAKRWLVKFSRKPLDKHPLFGFILDYNNTFTLIQEFEQSLFQIDGFSVFENKSVKDCWVYEDPKSFLSEVVRFEKLRPLKNPGISIQSWSDIIRTMNDQFPLIVIERESLEREVCHIGKVYEIKRNTFSMRDIDPYAEWEKKPSNYKFKDITKVKCGGRYETVLALVNQKRILK